MAADTQLEKMLRRPDPLLVFRWVVDDVPFGGNFNVGPEHVESIELPFNNVKVEGVFMGGGYNYFPGFHDVSAFGMTFYGDCKGQTLKYLMYWKEQVKSFSTGLYKLPKDYKRSWNVSLLDPMGNAVLKAELQGCWPADTGQVALDYNDGAGRISFSQNFSIDNMLIK